MAPDELGAGALKKPGSRRDRVMGRARRPQDPPVHSLSVFILGLFLLIIAVLLALASVYVLFVDDVWIKGVAEALKITN